VSQPKKERRKPKKQIRSMFTGCHGRSLGRRVAWGAAPGYGAWENVDSSMPLAPSRSSREQRGEKGEEEGKGGTRERGEEREA
jgi:hypothetical protein